MSNNGSSNRLKVFGSPERYVQGRNAIAHIGTEMSKLGMKGPVVIVSSDTPRRLLGSTWAKAMSDSEYSFVDYEFGGVCTAAEAARISEEAKSLGAKTLVAIGGGQVIDAVRAAAITADCEVVSCVSTAFY